MIDPDITGLSNLQRQVLYDVNDLNADKVEIARRWRLALINPHVVVELIAERLTPDENAAALIAGRDLVLDGTDDFATRLPSTPPAWRKERCWSAERPAAGPDMSASFRRAPCYRYLVPEAPPEAETCAAVGVVCALAGVIGLPMVVLEAVKLVTEARRAAPWPIADL